MIKLIYKNKQSYLTHSFPEYINSTADFVNIQNTSCILCKNGCGVYFNAYNLLIRDNSLEVYTNYLTMYNLDIYNYDNLYGCRYYTCDELLIKNILL